MGRNTKQHRQGWWGLTEKAAQTWTRSGSPESSQWSAHLRNSPSVHLASLEAVSTSLYYSAIPASCFLPCSRTLRGQSEEAGLSAKQLLIWADGRECLIPRRRTELRWGTQKATGFCSFQLWGLGHSALCLLTPQRSNLSPGLL